MKSAASEFGTNRRCLRNVCRCARIVRLMRKRSLDIEEEIRHLHVLESQLTDQKTLDGIKALIADLEAEKAELPPDE